MDLTSKHDGGRNDNDEKSGRCGLRRTTDSGQTSSVTSAFYWWAFSL